MFLGSMSLFGQPSKAASYYYINNKNEVIAEKMLLLKNKSFNIFAIDPGYNELIKDTVVNGDSMKVITKVPGHNYDFKSGSYKFKKKGNFIYVYFFDPYTDRIIKHKQYPLRLKDTTSYFYLFSPVVGSKPPVSGRAIFEGDTTIVSFGGLKHHCYRIVELQNHFEQKSPADHRIYIDVNSLLPVRYELLKEGKAYSTYLME